MSVVFSQYNQRLQAKAFSGTITGTFVYFTLPWWSRSEIESIRVWNTTGTNTSGYNIYILSNGAHFRFSPTEQDHFRGMAINVTAKADQLYTGIASFNPPIYVENEYNENEIYIMVDLGASKTNINVGVDVVGKKALYTRSALGELTDIYAAKDYRVIIGKAQVGGGGTGGTIYDVNAAMQNRGNLNADQCSFSSATDYVYVGSSERIRHWQFKLSQGAVTNTVLTGEYWNGSAWSTTSLTLLDNTSTGNSDTMKFSGLVEFKNLHYALWKPTQLDGTGTKPLDPLVTMINAVTAGTARPMITNSNPDRYWMRFKVGDVTGGSILIDSITPVKEYY